MVFHSIHKVFQFIDDGFHVSIVFPSFEQSLQDAISIKHESFDFLVGRFYLLVFIQVQQLDPVQQILQFGLVANLSVPNYAVVLNPLDDFLELVAITLFEGLNILVQLAQLLLIDL
jgi:hypothetical protein